MSSKGYKIPAAAALVVVVVATSVLGRKGLPAVASALGVVAETHFEKDSEQTRRCN